MSNQLSMEKVLSIKQLHASGWSIRRISRSLSIDRKTVKRHLLEADSKGTTAAAQAPTAHDDVQGDSKGTTQAAKAPTAQLTESQRENGKSRSICHALHDVIVQGIERQLTAQRIYQDLVNDHCFKGSYWSVNRYVKSITRSIELPFRRMEKLPGEEAQIDFGTGAPYIDADGKLRKTHVLRVVLSHSRKAYSEVVTKQTTENFLRAIENAFYAFGGTPKTLVIDNLKAAVTKADWYDPEINPKMLDFCQHYKVAVLPTKPYTPRHKGKVERGIAYVQDNALKGRRFKSLAEQNAFLENWEANVADKRIHGTIKRQVGQLFEEVERHTLQPLPSTRFPYYHENQRIVSRDGHIEVAKGYYSAPPEYVGRQVWVRWDARTVALLNDRWQQIALHVRVEPGKRSTHASHLVSEKINGIERGLAYHLKKVSLIGPCTTRWAESMLEAKGIGGWRVLQGLLSLAGKHDSRQIETACDTAWRSQNFRLKAIRENVDRIQTTQVVMDFIEEHPLIRSPQEYAQFVHNIIQGGL